ncbi:putative oxidoreductase [Williamsia limnetica]|jgi:putative oxidoreductase|uniref:Putative oxidoreductase n=1 Tax=Williamsia limnetica TaxID=882452 RepID=A0A318S0Z1_WILLI|nr:DoxX family protein [Williamsia limnetica]PYE16845.1 putative oxidoreductase [Williamsia limnetica]
MGTSRNFASLVARVILGVIFIFHGWQKLHTNGISATEAFFKSLDIPFPKAAAWYSALVEFGGGILLILGVLMPLVSLLLIADMIGAIFYAHIDKGFWNADGGYELPLALIAGLVAVGLAETGRTGADGYFTSRRRNRV